MFAKFSPDSTRVAYVRANNIYVEKLDDGAITQLTCGRIGDDDQRHVRLGLRRRARRARFVPLEPGQRQHRLLAVRFHRRRHLLADQHDRHALSRRDDDSLSEGRHDQLRGADRRDSGGGRRDAVDEDAGRSARELSGAHGVARRAHGRHPAAQPSAERERLPARRCSQRRGPPLVSRRVEGVGGRRRGAVDRQGPVVPVDQRARRLAPRLPRAARGRRRRSWSRASTPTSPTSPASTKPAAGSTSSPRRTRRPIAISIDRGSTAPARRSG